MINLKLKAKKSLLILLFLLFFCSESYSKNFSSNDLVDLNDNHWAYKSAINGIDKYKIFDCFDDHTFRGNKEVSLEELSYAILNFLKYYENEKGLSFKNKSNYPFKKDFFTNIEKSKYYEQIKELKDYYGIVIAFYDDKSFSPERKIDNYDLIYSIDKIIFNISNGIKNSKSSPYQKNVESINMVDLEGKNNFSDKIKKSILKTEIIQENSLDTNEVVTRYRLSVIFDKIFDYIIVYEQQNL